MHIGDQATAPAWLPTTRATASTSTQEQTGPPAPRAPGPVTTWWEQVRLGFNDDDGHHTAASLGPFKCPDGWLTLASSPKDAQHTVAMCCPSSRENGNGTTIGASVGASLGVMALVLAAAWLVVRRRRRKFLSPGGRGELEGSVPVAAPRWRGVELPAAATPLGRSRTDSTKRKPASEPPGALDQRVVAELDEGWQR
ncbi:hypothetical protein PGQ11_005237 [Apiospora arundinis]|uniref:Uncharacterized protein n=1 Tax=Apiospora arundinis TaxID=335852 RepID=A0ABR2JA93_9PEZI